MYFISKVGELQSPTRRFLFNTRQKALFFKQLLRILQCQIFYLTALCVLNRARNALDRIADRDWVFLSTAGRFMIAVQASTTKSSYHCKFRCYIKNTSNLKWLCIPCVCIKYWWLADTRIVKQTTSLAKQRLRYKESAALQAVPVINVPVWFPGKIDFSTFPASLKHVQPFPLDTIGTTQLCEAWVVKRCDVIVG